MYNILINTQTLPSFINKLICPYSGLSCSSWFNPLPVFKSERAKGRQTGGTYARNGMHAPKWHFTWHTRFCHHWFKGSSNLTGCISGYYYLVIVEANTEMNRIYIYNRNILTNWRHIWATYCYHTLGRRPELYRISLIYCKHWHNKTHSAHKVGAIFFSASRNVINTSWAHHPCAVPCLWILVSWRLQVY